MFFGTKTSEIATNSSCIIENHRDRSQQIQEQLEYYFSDSNIANNPSFKKLMQQSHDGFIPVDTFLKYNRFIELNTSSEEIIDAAKQSNILQVNDDNQKIKRIKKYVEDPKRKDRMVYINGFDDNETLENLYNLFSNSFGIINRVSMHHIKDNNNYRIFKGSVVVELESIEQANRIVAMKYFNYKGNNLFIIPLRTYETNVKKQSMTKNKKKNQIKCSKTTGN